MPRLPRKSGRRRSGVDCAGGRGEAGEAAVEPGGGEIGQAGEHGAPCGRWREINRWRATKSEPSRAPGRASQMSAGMVAVQRPMSSRATSAEYPIARKIRKMRADEMLGKKSTRSNLRTTG